jgi:hypothetical protein
MDSTTCTAGSPPPVLTDTKTTVDSTKTDNPDGSTKTDTTTETTTTGCYGVKPCKTDTTTKNETDKTNPDGMPGDKTSSCTGSKCTDDGEPDDPTKDPEEEEEKPDPSEVTGGATCDAPPTCKGDAVQCAILKQQYESRCNFEESQDFPGKKSDIESLFQGEQFELDGTEIEAPSFINQGTRFLPSSCPPPEQISLTSNGGHTYQLSYDPICSVASDFSFLIVAMVGLWCAAYVGRAFGGE